jgi:hypothetical protein
MAAACSADHGAACGTEVQRLKWYEWTPLASDWLFVIDNGPSMAEEQRMLAEQWPAVAEMLLRGNARDGDPDWAPLDLHVGVITTDLGAGADDVVPGCSARGDDGLLRAPQECGLEPAPYEWRYPGYHDDAAAQRAITCAARLNTSGCEVSQPLEAVLKALLPAQPLRVSPDAVQPRAPSSMEFLDGTNGHGMDTNQGFLRDGELWIVIITDQDDCSTRDAALFTPKGPHDIAPAQRCLQRQANLRAIQDYVTAISELRPEVWGELHFVIVAGFPPDLLDAETKRLLRSPSILRREEAPRYQAYQRIKNDARMQVQIGDEAAPGEPPSLRASCRGPNTSAYPPQRLLDFAYGLGSQATIASICDLDLAKLIQDELFPEVTERKVVSTACRLRKRLRDSEGRVDCRATLELIPEPDASMPLTPSRCSDRPDVLQDVAPGFPAQTKDGHPLCEVRQAPVSRAADGSVIVDGPGWYYYDDDEAEALGYDRCTRPGYAGFGFTAGAFPVGALTFQLECVDEDERPECAE